MTNGNLPAWDDMSELDKGAALLHLWKRDQEGGRYAVENYPAEYFDDPALVALDDEEASRHAASLGSNFAVAERVGWDEYHRLYDLALAADDARGASKAR